jgi:diguanylate cyclase (GGDEF)-like protein
MMPGSSGSERPRPTTGLSAGPEPDSGATTLPGADLSGSNLLSIQTWNAVQRAVFLWLGPAGVLACAAALATQWPDIDPFDRVSLPLLALVLTLMSAVLALNRLKIQTVTRITFVATTLYFLLGLNHQFWQFVPQHQMLSESSYWFAVLYATAFIAFRAEQAIRVCGAVFACSLVICAVHLSLLGMAGGLNSQVVASISQFLLSSAVLVLAQFAVGRLRQQLDQVRAAAYLDVLTGLPNRRYAHEQLGALIQAQTPFSLVMIDIDHFKQVNDTYGHQAGDMVLRETGRVISKHLSAQQFMARWGGEEFVLVLPGMHKRGGKLLAEAARRDLYQHVFEQVGGLTASFGVAECVTSDDLEAVMRRADAALYAAKRQGRNGVRVAMDDGRLTRLDLPDAEGAPEPLVAPAQMTSAQMTAAQIVSGQVPQSNPAPNMTEPGGLLGRIPGD